MTPEQLIEAAIKAREHSYAPYSHFQVGAAIETSDGHIYTGCNIENMGFSPTICAERTAISKAVSEGFREFTQIAIVGGLPGPLTQRCAPCGMCREVMGEFCEPDFEVHMARSTSDYETVPLKTLLPYVSKPDFSGSNPFGGFSSQTTPAAQ